MTVFLFFVGLVQCFLLWLMAQAGRGLLSRAAKEREQARYNPSEGWPACALIIPVAGEHPFMETALRSLLEQDYPNFSAHIITAASDDAAMGVIKRLKGDFPGLEHIAAGKAETCGQKNHNLLAGVASVGKQCEVYVFCDATHAARPDFLRCLIGPVARGEAAFTTGYHEVEPGDDGIVSLAYSLSVMAMRFLQGMAAFTQPWGGAMAMRRKSFERCRVAELWKRNVVDDCSLAGWLRKEGVQPRLCPAALLRTPVQGHALPVWRAWLTRQILFLKFCMPGQWIALGFFCALMLLPPLWCGVAILRGLLGIGGGMAPFLALCWLCLAAWAAGCWRRFAPRKIGQIIWLWSFLCACVMFAVAYTGSILTKNIVWRNIVYKVGKNGQVERIERL